MKQFETMTEALNDLSARGFTYNFNLRGDCVECIETGRVLQPEDFDIVEYYRFEGMTDPAESSVVYALASRDGLKGTFVNAYGLYADPVSDALVAKLKIHD